MRKGTRDKVNQEEKKSFKEQASALKNLPKFFRMVWETSPGLTVINLLLRLVKAALPLAMLYVGKLIIDEVIRLIDVAGDQNLTYLWTLVALELGLAVLSDLTNRGITLVDSLLGDLFSNRTSVALIEHAAKLDLAQFEDATFYDKLERARRQTVTRVVLMSQVLSQLQDIVTIGFLSVGLIA
ncbi:MAG: ABC transporter ATP-binding protein, partial [Pontibacter sp.]|nr:ABC transporter ATP-binding protein [Pontibacter sp.]